MNQASRIKFLRIVGISEGVSFLFLLGIAMPLKYFFGYPEVVKAVGWIHGLLFMLYILAVLLAIRPMQWKFFGVITALAASLLPGGTFVLDGGWKKKLLTISRLPLAKGD